MSKTLKLTRELEIMNQLGIHARPAAMFVKAASRFQASCQVERKGARVNGKSIMGMLTLEAAKGTRITLTIEGPDAEEMMETLARIVESKFNEE